MFASVVTFVMRHHTRPADMRRYRESRSLPIGRWKGGFTGGIQGVTSVEGSVLSRGLEVVDLRQETRMSPSSAFVTVHKRGRGAYHLTSQEYGASWWCRW